MKKVIIIGASSGIGSSLAKIFSDNDFIVAMASRRVELLQELKKTLKNESFIKQIDITKPDMALNLLYELIEQMGGVDIVIINAGTGFAKSKLDWYKDKCDWEKERITIDTNVVGFTAIAMGAYQYFLKKKTGHIVGISSIAALFPNSGCPAYSASKAFVSNYLESLRIHAYKEKMPIFITDIKPGFVDTAMAQRDIRFWVAPVEKAAKQIFDKIIKKKEHAYITRRWNLVAFFSKFLPKMLYKKIF